MRSIGVAIEHPDPGLVDELVHAVEAAPDLYLALEPSKAAVVVAGPDELRSYASDPPAAGVAIVGLAAGEDLAAVARVALRCRAHEIVSWPADREELRRTVHDAASRARLAAGGVDGRIVAVAGARGGAGTTTVTALIARALPDAVVVDLDAPGGGQCAFLPPDVEPTLETVLGVVEDLEPRGFGSAFVRHAAGRALCAEPRTIAPGKDRAGRLLELLRATAPFSVIDVGRAGDLGAMTVLREADVALCVCGPDLQSMRGARALRGIVPKLRFVLNQATRLRLSVRDVTRVLGVGPAAVIPLEPAVRRAGEAGRLTSKRRSGRAIERLAASLLEEVSGER